MTIDHEASLRLEEVERIGKFGSWEWNLETDEFRCSEGFFRIVEWTREKVPTYRSFLSLIEESDRAVLEQAIEASLVSKQSFSGAFRFHPVPGAKPRWMQIEGRPVHNDGRKIVRIIALVQDVTDKVQNEAELAEMTFRAELASRRKAEFLANISHEIRTPMNGILGICNLLLSSVKDPGHRDHLKIIQSCGSSLVCLINDILDFSKLEAEQVEFESVPFNLPDLVQEIIYLFSASASEKNVLLSYAPETSTPYSVLGDPGRLKQILANLVSNSIKFTNSGRIQIFSEAKRHESGKLEVQLSVKDSGIGISKENQSKLFNFFSQADASTTRKYGGTGLGLAICRKLCEKMGGKIWLNSEMGQGSTFFFTLLLSEAQENESIYSSALPIEVDSKMSEKHPLKILVAEDNQVNQIVAIGLLKQLGYVPDLVSNGREALDRLKLESYDIIFMDYHMPQMDGIEATREIRKQYSDPNRPYIIALTASAMKENVEECFSSGMNDFVSKPVQLTDLTKVLSKFLSKEGSRALKERSREDNDQAREAREELVLDPIGEKRVSHLMPVFDKKRFVANFSGLEDVLTQTVQSFLKHRPKLIKDIQDATVARDAKALELAAHTLKGAVSNFFAGPARLLAEELERAGKAGNLIGVDDLIPRLVAEVDRFCEALTELQPVQQTRVSRGKTILIVDDSEFDRNLLISALPKKGDFNILEAGSGEECQRILSSNPVDLVLMDVLMPGIDGRELLATVRKKSNPIELPIIMITANTDSSDVVEALQLGANDYITKPVNFEVAVSRISTHLKLAETSLEMRRLREISALHAMVSTYNHEINNPLAIALGCLGSPSWNKSETSVKKLEDALWRIADIVKKIAKVTEKEIQYQDYTKSQQVLKVR